MGRVWKGEEGYMEGWDGCGSEGGRGSIKRARAFKLRLHGQINGQ